MKLSIIIPVFDEIATVGELLRRVWEVPLDGLELAKELVIVESNSTDGSREAVKAFAASKQGDASAELRVVWEDRPQGKGHAVRAGLAAATGDILLIQDADLEYKVEDYASLVEPILAGRAAFVLGSRHLSAGNWRIRRFAEDRVTSTVMNFGGVFFHAFFNVLHGTSLTDPTTMFKVFRRSCIDGVTFTGDRFDFDYELVSKLIRLGHVPLEVPVSYESRGFEEGKKIRVIRDPANWLWAIVKYRLQDPRG